MNLAQIAISLKAAFSSYSVMNVFGGIPSGIPPSSYVGNNGLFILGNQSGGGTATFSSVVSGTTTLAGVQTITDTAGHFQCTATTLSVGQTVLVSGTAGGTGTIGSYASPTAYLISVTNGTTTFTLTTLASGAITTTIGTLTMSFVTGAMVTLGAAGFAGTSVDVGKVITLISGSDPTVRFTITGFFNTLVAVGTISSTLTNLTAVVTWALANPFLSTYTACYMNLPASAIFAGSLAGSYYAQMSSVTVGQLFSSGQYTTGVPQLQSAPTAFVTTGPGFFTQVQINTMLVTIPIAANTMGQNGYAETIYSASVPGNTNTKTIGVFFGGINGVGYGANTLNSATTPGCAGHIEIQNRGAGLQIGRSLPFSTAGAGSGAPSYSAIDTTQNTSIVYTGRLNTSPTDFVVFEGIRVNVNFQ